MWTPGVQYACFVFIQSDHPTYNSRVSTPLETGNSWDVGTADRTEEDPRGGSLELRDAADGEEAGRMRPEEKNQANRLWDHKQK